MVSSEKIILKKCFDKWNLETKLGRDSKDWYKCKFINFTDIGAGEDHVKESLSTCSEAISALSHIKI